MPLAKATRNKATLLTLAQESTHYDMLSTANPSNNASLYGCLLPRTTIFYAGSEVCVPHAQAVLLTSAPPADVFVLEENIDVPNAGRARPRTTRAPAAISCGRSPCKSLANEQCPGSAVRGTIRTYLNHVLSSVPARSSTSTTIQDAQPVTYMKRDRIITGRSFRIFTQRSSGSASLGIRHAGRLGAFDGQVGRHACSSL